MSGIGSSTPSWQPLDSTPDQVKSFASSQAAKNWTPQQIGQISTAGTWSGQNGFFGSQNFGSSDITDLVNAFQAWKISQNNAQTGWQNYADLVTREAGGEGTQTIMGQAAATPGQSILAGAGIGNPTQVNTVQKRIGRMGAP